MSTRFSTAAAAVALGAAVLSVAACSSGGDDASASNGSGSSDDSSLVIANSRGVTTFEGDSCFTASAMVLIYDGLLRISDDGGVTGGIAESYEYDDATYTYTFHLRADAGFSNGDPVTAEDVKFSIDTWKAGEYSGSFYSTIAEAAVVDESTVTVTMTGPDSFLPAMLTWCSSTIYPADFAGESEEDYFAKPISAGTYTVDSTTDFGGPSETVHLVRNPNHWNADDLLLDSIDFTLISDANQRTLQFESGSIDVIQGLDPSAAAQLSEDQLVYIPSAAQEQLVLNTADDALSDPDVRQAISLALDRAELVTALDGRAEAVTGVLPANLPNVVDPDQPYTFDADEATSLLAGRDVSVSLLYPSANESAETVLQVAAAQLAKVGITATLQPSDAATVSSQVQSGDFQLAYMVLSAISPSAFDPAALLPYSRYPAAGADASVAESYLLEGMAAITDEGQQAAVLGIQNDAVAQNAVIGLVQLQAAFAVSTDVSGLVPTSYSSIFYPEGITNG